MGLWTWEFGVKWNLVYPFLRLLVNVIPFSSDAFVPANRVTVDFATNYDLVERLNCTNSYLKEAF